MSVFQRDLRANLIWFEIGREKNEEMLTFAECRVLCSQFLVIKLLVGALVSEQLWHLNNVPNGSFQRVVFASIERKMLRSRNLVQKRGRRITVPDTANWESSVGALNEKKVIAYVGIRLSSQLQKILPNSDQRSTNTISATGRDGDSRGVT